MKYTRYRSSPLTIWTRKLVVILVAVATFVGIMLVAPTPAGAIFVRTSVHYRPRPVMRTAAVVGTAAVTAAVVGSIVYSLPPACQSTVVGNVVYQECGGTWYQPRYAGSQVTYIVVNPPE